MIDVGDWHAQPLVNSLGVSDVQEVRPAFAPPTMGFAVKRIALLLALAASVSCATTTMITTDAPGASVVREKDKVELGVTPYKYTTSMWIWESDKLNVTSKAGQTKSIEVKRSEFDMVPGASYRTALAPSPC